MRVYDLGKAVNMAFGVYGPADVLIAGFDGQDEAQADADERNARAAAWGIKARYTVKAKAA